jgi:hypothetical protein
MYAPQRSQAGVLLRWEDSLADGADGACRREIKFVLETLNSRMKLIAPVFAPKGGQLPWDILIAECLLDR